MPLTNRAVAASDSSPLELCWLSQQDHSFIFLIQRIEHKKPARSTDNTRSFKSFLLGARCRGCGPHAPAPRSGGSGHFLSPLFQPRRCGAGGTQRCSPRAAFPAGDFLAELLVSAGEEVCRVSAMQWPAGMAGPVICHHRAQQISARRARIVGKCRG